MEKVKSFLQLNNLRNKVETFYKEKIENRKAMFIPITAVGAFMLVGYAAADTKAPEIKSTQIDIPYGEKFDADIIDIEDDRDTRDLIVVEGDFSKINTNQLGSYKVTVRARDSFNNESEKEITVTVVDEIAPQFEVLGASEGYAVEVPVKASSDLSSYIKAVDNVDGDVTPFIQADKELDTRSLSSQLIHLTVSDSSGNVASKTIEFVVSDTEAPEISFKKGKSAVLNYGSAFNIYDYITVTDNFDDDTDVSVEGKIDNKKEGVKQTLKITASDKSNNKSTATLEITVRDTQAPVINLSRSSVSVNQNGSINLKSYLSSATDNKDGNLTSKVSIPTVSTKKAGTFTATYKVTDKAGNVGTKSIKVTVKPVYSDSSRPNYYGTSVVGAAYSRLGCRYVYGSTGPNTFDCSGLVKWCYAKAGKNLPRTSSAQASCGTRVSISNAKPGDILWRPGHVGIYIGGGKYIHAPHTGDVVKISSGASSFRYAVRP